MEFESAFAEPHELIRFGPLALPTGQVVTCDPYFCAGATPLAPAVPPGRYQVELRRVRTEAGGKRIGLARLVVRPEPAIRWEPASQGFAGTGGFFVDSGVASYMDEAAREALETRFTEFYQANPTGNYYTDVLEAEFEKNIDPDDPTDYFGRWVLHQIGDSGLNVAIFSSGYGDGSYQSWWGLDADGEIVSLVTDFGIL